MKKKAQYGLKEKGVFLNSNVNNRQVPVKLNSGEIIYVDAINGRTLDSDSIVPTDSTYVDRGLLSNKATTFKSKKQNNSQLKKKQFGGDGQEVIVEDGEIYQDEFGNIIESNSFDHEDEFILLDDGTIGKSPKNAGGELVNAQTVVSDSYEKVKNGDRKNSEKERVLKFTPNESRDLLKGSLHWFNTKKSMSPAELIREAVDQTNKFSTKTDKYEPYDKYGKNSQSANASQIPDEQQIYDLVFQEQERRKEESGLFVEDNEMQYGGIPTSYDGLNAYPNQPVIVPSNQITMEDINYPVNAYDADTLQYLETMQPNEDYYFEGSDNILEIPQAKYGLKKAQSGIDVRSHEIAINSLKNLLKNAKTSQERNLINSKIIELNKKMPPINIEENVPEPYIIKQGDSLSKIANTYGLTVDDLMNSNPDLADKNKITTGDKLNIPDVTIKGKRNTGDFDMNKIYADAIKDSRFLNTPAGGGVVENVERISEVSPVDLNSTQDYNIGETVKNVLDAVEIGKIDRTQGTNALRQMMMNNRSVALPYRTEIPGRTLNYLEEDVTPYLDEIDTSVQQQLQYINPNTTQGQSMLANISNRADQAKRQTINRVNQSNLQRRSQTDNQNVQLQNQFDLMQEQANKNYVDEVYQTIANQDRNRVQQAQYLDDMIDNNTRTNNAFLMSNIKNPNFQIDPISGVITRIGEKFNSGANTTINKAYEDMSISELEKLLKEKKKSKYGLKKKI